MISVILTVVVCLAIAVQVGRGRMRRPALAIGPSMAVTVRSAPTAGLPRWLVTLLKAGGVLIAAGAFLLLAGQAASAEETVDDQVAAAGQQLVRDLSADDAADAGGDTTGGSGDPEPSSATGATGDSETANTSDGTGSDPDDLTASDPGADGSAEGVDPAAAPAAVDPAAVDPAAVDPAAVDPAAVDPAAVDPAPADPAAVDITPADPDAAALRDQLPTDASAGTDTGNPAAAVDPNPVPAADDVQPPAATATGAQPASQALTGNEQNAPANDQQATDGPANWILDLIGAGTLSSDGLSVWLAPADGSSTGLSRLLDRILTIVVNGRGATNTLTVTGPLGRLLTYLGAGDDRLVLGSGANTIRVTGDRRGTVGDSTDSPSVTFTGVGEVGSAGADTYVVDGPANLNTLTLDNTDKLVVDKSGSSLAGDLLTVGSVVLAGTLQVLGGQQPGAPFLSFGKAEGDFDTFRGLDLGAGAYLRPVLDAAGYRLAASNLPGGMTVQFPTADDADDFFAQLSGKTQELAAGTPVSVDVLDHRLTGALTVHGTADNATLELTGTNLLLGDPTNPLAVLAADGPVVLSLTSDAVAGQFTGRLTSTVPGVGFDGRFTVTLDTATRSLTATGTDVAILLAGQRIAIGSLTIATTRGPDGWLLRLTGPAGAVITFGTGDGILRATLLERLNLTIAATGLLTALPVAATLAGVPGTSLSGPFELRVDTSTQQVSLVSANATLTAGGAALTGALTLRPVLTPDGGQAVLATFGSLDITILGGVLALLGLTGGAFLLTRSGAVGSASGAPSLTMDGLAGSAGSATIDLNTTGWTGTVRYLIGGLVRSMSARGPPLVVELSDVHAISSSPGGVAVTGSITLTSPNSTTGTSSTTSTLQVSASSLTSAGQPMRLTISPDGLAIISLPAPAPWRVVLDATRDHQVVIAVDGTDLLVTVDGVTTRRAVQTVTALTIAGGSRADTLRLTGALPVPVTFAGGAGVDTIFGPAADTRWNITGAGSGTVAGLTFSGVEWLRGAAGNEDTFVVSGAGSIAGGVHGGDGGYDVLRFDGQGNSGALVYRPDGLQSGVVTVGGTSIRFDGLEPVSSTRTAAVVELTYAPHTPADQLVLTALSPTQLRVSSTMAESIDFAVPTGSLTINAAGAKVTISGVINLGGATLIVNDASEILITGTLTAGVITLKATSLATVSANSVITSTGDLTITVDAALSLTWISADAFFRTASTTARLTIAAGARVQAQNVVLTVSSSTTKIAMVELDQSRLGGAAGMKPQMAPNARPTFTAGATPTIVRTSGSWLTDGFRAGMWIRVSNSTSNNGFFKIVSVTSTTVTVDASTPVTAESGDSEIVLEGVHLIQGDPALTFGGQNVTRGVGSWLADGFSRGQTVVITGTPDTNGDGIGDNDGERTVVDVTTTLLTLDAGSGLIGQAGVTGVKIWSAGTPGDLPIVVIDPDTALQPVDVGLTFAGSTITRLDGRNWADDGFAVGQFALVTGETANRGSYWVRTVSGTVLTLLTAAPFTAETDIRGVDVVAAAVFGSQSLIENQTGLTFDGTTVVRADGMSWSTEGFAVGQILVVKNTKTSDGSYRISALSGTTMTLASLTTTALSLAQENTANATTAISVSAVVSMRNATIVFADHGITRSRGSWTTDGFAAGDRISVRGGSANAGQYLIQSISADGRTLTVTAGTGAPDTENPLVTEGIYAVRVRGLLPFDQLTVGLFDDALSGRLLSGEGGAWIDLLAKIITQAPERDPDDRRWRGDHRRWRVDRHGDRHLGAEVELGQRVAGDQLRAEQSDRHAHGRRGDAAGGRGAQPDQRGGQHHDRGDRGQRRYRLGRDEQVEDPAGEPVRRHPRAEHHGDHRAGHLDGGHHRRRRRPARGWHRHHQRDGRERVRGRAARARSRASSRPTSASPRAWSSRTSARPRPSP